MVLLVFLAALTDVGAVEIVPGVELDTRLRGQDLEQTTGARVIERRGQRQGVVLRVEAIVVVVATGVPIGWGKLGDPGADLHRLGEIHHRILDRLDLAGGYPAAIDRGVVIRGDHQLVVENRSAAGTGQVEVGVMGQVDRRGLVGLGPIADDQLVGVGELVDDPDVKVAGIALLPIGTLVGAKEHGGPGPLDGLDLPVSLIESLDTTVQVVSAIVLRQGVLLVADLELTARDPVRDPAGGGAKIGMARQVAFEGIEAKHHILELPIAAGNMQLRQQRTVGHDLRRNAVLVHHRVELDGIAFGGLAERGHGELAGCYRAGYQQEETGNEAENSDELHEYAP